VVRFELHEREEVARRGVGDEEVEPAEAILDLIEHRLGLLKAFQIGADRQRGRPEALDLGDGVARRSLVATVVDHRRRAAGGQGQRERASDPA